MERRRLRLLLPTDNIAFFPARPHNQWRRRVRRESLPSSAMATATIIILFMVVTVPVVTNALSGWSFLPNQSECRLKCQNGGVCAFNTDDPEWHKCICFIGMFHGEQCEIAVPSDGGANHPLITHPEADNNEIVAEEEGAEDVRQSTAPLDVEDHTEGRLGGIGGDFGTDEGEDEMAKESNSPVTTVSSAESTDYAQNPVDSDGEPISYEAELVTAADGPRGALVINQPGRHLRPDVGETLEMTSSGHQVGRAPPAFQTTTAASTAVSVSEQQEESQDREEAMTTSSTVSGEQHAVIPTPPQDVGVSSATTVDGRRHFALTAADSPLGPGDGGGHASTSAFADTVTASSTAGRRRIGGRTRPRRPPTAATSTTAWPTDDDEWDGGWMMSAKRSARSAAASQRPTAPYSAAVALLSALAFHLFQHSLWTVVV